MILVDDLHVFLSISPGKLPSMISNDTVGSFVTIKHNYNTNVANSEFIPQLICRNFGILVHFPYKIHTIFKKTLF